MLRFKKEGPEEDDEEEGNKEGVPINYAATLQLHTPWKAVSLLRMTALVEMVDANSKVNLTILTNQTWFTVETNSVV